MNTFHDHLPPADGWTVGSFVCTRLQGKLIFRPFEASESTKDQTEGISCRGLRVDASKVIVSDRGRDEDYFTLNSAHGGRRKSNVTCRVECWHFPPATPFQLSLLLWSQRLRPVTNTVRIECPVFRSCLGQSVFFFSSSVISLGNWLHCHEIAITH